MMSLLFSASIAAQPAPSQPAIDARTIAAAIQPRLPQRFSPDVSLVGASAEDNLVVLTVEASAARLAALTPAGIERAVAGAFCAPAAARATMAGPLSLRVDARVPGGQIVIGTVLENCPLPRPLSLR